MKTFERECIKKYSIIDMDNNKFELTKGKKYITSEIIDDYVTVFSEFWVKVPIKYFSNRKFKRFT